VNEFVTSLKSLEVGPLIAAFRERLTEIAYGELERHRRRLGHLTADQEKALKHMLDGIVNKFAHPAIAKFHQAARSDSPSPENLDVVDIWSEAFELKEKGEMKRET
jgi:glutamyl-tRNA reductase